MKSKGTKIVVKLPIPLLISPWDISHVTAQRIRTATKIYGITVVKPLKLGVGEDCKKELRIIK